MYAHLLKNIIELEWYKNCCARFKPERRVDGKFGISKYALSVKFHGYNDRDIHLIIYGEMNYVGVYTHTNNEELVCHGFHDSCWTESLEIWLRNNEKAISSILNWPRRCSQESGWCDIIEPDENLLKAFRKARSIKQNAT